ncbi:MAG: hypothetical protein JWO74_3504 [Solirubrobacterales bacterium]|nr:hypothetical protein [Solirubrobacterales bacterium]
MAPVYFERKGATLTAEDDVKRNMRALRCFPDHEFDEIAAAADVVGGMTLKAVACPLPPEARKPGRASDLKSGFGGELRARRPDVWVKRAQSGVRGSASGAAGTARARDNGGSQRCSRQA